MSTQQKPQTAWDLISMLIEEATGMTGDEAADRIRVERGAQWVERFRQEHPLAAIFIKQLMTGSPDAALAALAVVNPAAAQLPFARAYLAELQRRLRNGSK